MTTKEILAKLRTLPHGDVGEELTGLSEEELIGLITAHQAGCHEMKDFQVALCDIEPLEDSVFEENLFGLYLRAGDKGGHHLLTLPKIGVDTQRMVDTNEEGERMSIMVAPVQARYIRGIRLIYSMEVLPGILKNLRKDELVVVCAVQSMWEKDGGPREGFTNHVEQMEQFMPKLIEQTPKGRLVIGSLLPITGKRDVPEMACILNEKTDGGANYTFVRAMRPDYEGNPVKTLPKEAYQNLKRCPDEVIYELMMDYSTGALELFYELQKSAIEGEFQASYEESRKR